MWNVQWLQKLPIFVFCEKQHVVVYKKQMTAPKYFNVTDYNGLMHVWFCFSFNKVTISRPTHLKYEGYSVLWPMSINTVYINTIGNFRNQSENVDRHKMFLKFLFLQIFYHIMTFLVYTQVFFLLRKWRRYSASSPTRIFPLKIQFPHQKYHFSPKYNIFSQRNVYFSFGHSTIIQFAPCTTIFLSLSRRTQKIWESQLF